MISRVMDFNRHRDRIICLLVVGAFSAGFIPQEAALTFVTEDEVFGAPRVVRQKAPPRLSAMLAALDDLAPGDLVVHADHGVSRYEGLVSLAVGPAESDFLLLTYQGGDKLYLPADRMGLISKYRGPDEGKPGPGPAGRPEAGPGPRAGVKRAVEAIATGPGGAIRRRAAILKGHAFSQPDKDFPEFEAHFAYQETPDQARAIDEVISRSGPSPGPWTG